MLKRELKINIKGLIIWTGIVIAFFLVVFAVYPSIASNENSKMLNDMLKMFPQEMLAMFNMDIVGINSAFGWFQTEGYVILTLIGGLYAAILGATILVKEESDKTIEFLYSKPISRNKIVTSKIIAGGINISVFTIIVLLFNWCGLTISGDLNMQTFLMLSLAPLLLYYGMFFVSLFVSTFLKKAKQAMGIGLGIVFVSYFAQIVGGMSDKIAVLKNISFFEFVSSRYIILNNSINVKFLIIGIIIIFACIVGTYIRYNKKELV